METFLKLFDLIETSLSRILRQWEDQEFVVISSDRGEKSPQENVKDRVKLKQELKRLGYGYVPVEGVGQETGPDGEIVPTTEHAYLVPNNVRGGGKKQEFLQDMLTLAREFNQWGICHARGDGSGSLVKSNGEPDAQFNSFSAGAATFFTRLQQSRGRSRTNTFHLESLSKSPKASTILEQQARHLRGELFSMLGREVEGITDLDAL